MKSFPQWIIGLLILAWATGCNQGQVTDQRTAGEGAHLDPIRTSANAHGYDPVDCDPLYFHDGVCDEPDGSATTVEESEDAGAEEQVDDSVEREDSEDQEQADEQLDEQNMPADEMEDAEVPVEEEEEPEVPAGPQVVEFRIEAGTGGEAWNDVGSMVQVKVGDTLRIINDDNVNHRLHTSGEPCAHGSNIPPGGTFDCVISAPVEPGNSPPTYDHNYGRNAAFFVRATQ